MAFAVRAPWRASHTAGNRIDAASWATERALLGRRQREFWGRTASGAERYGKTFAAASEELIGFEETLPIAGARMLTIEAASAPTFRMARAGRDHSAC